MASAALKEQREQQLQQAKLQQEIKRTHREVNLWMQNIFDKAPHHVYGLATHDWAAVKRFFDKMPEQPTDVLSDGLGALLEYCRLQDVPGSSNGRRPDDRSLAYLRFVFVLGWVNLAENGLMESLRTILVNLPQMEGSDQVKSRIAATALALISDTSTKVGNHPQVHDDYILRFVEYTMDSWQRNHHKQPAIDITRLCYLAQLIQSKSKLVSITCAQVVFQISQNSAIPLADNGAYFSDIIVPLARVAAVWKNADEKFYAELAAELGGNARLRAIAGAPTTATGQELTRHLHKVVSTAQQTATFAICTLL